MKHLNEESVVIERIVNKAHLNYQNSWLAQSVVTSPDSSNRNKIRLSRAKCHAEKVEIVHAIVESSPRYDF